MHQIGEIREGDSIFDIHEPVSRPNAYLLATGLHRSECTRLLSSDLDLVFSVRVLLEACEPSVLYLGLKALKWFSFRTHRSW